MTSAVALAAAARVLDSLGLVAGFGHVSTRVPGDDRFLLTPRIAPGLTTPDDVLVVDLAGHVTGAANLPIEWHVHASVYGARPDVAAVARVHSFPANVLSVVAEPIRPAHYLGAILQGDVAIHDAPDLVTDEGRGRQMAVALGSAAGLLLRGNGQVVVGSTVAEACVRAVYLDEAARLQLAAISTGREVAAYRPEELSRFAAVWNDLYNVERAWRYYVERAGT